MKQRTPLITTRDNQGHDWADFVFPSGYTLEGIAAASRDDRVAALEHDKLLFDFYYLPDHFSLKYGIPACLLRVFAFLEARYERGLLQAWRGFGKSTIVSLGEVMHEVYYGRAPYVLLLSQSYETIQDNHDTLKRVLAENDRLAADFGAMKPVIDRRIGGEDSRWAIGDIITTTGVRIRMRGMKQRIRGTKYDQFRPYLVVVDDPEDETNTRSAEELRGNIRWLNKSVVGALDPEFGRILVAGNLICPGCMVHTLSHSGFWKTIALSIVGEDDATPTWAQKFSMAWIDRKRAYFESMGDYDAFDWEFRNIAESGRRQGFRHEDARFWDGELVTKPQFSYLVLKAIGQYAGPHNMSITWKPVDELVPVVVTHGKDLAFTTKSYSDFNVDTIVATDAKGRRFVVEVDEYKESCPTAVIDHAFAQYRKYRPTASGIETHHGQVYLAVALRGDPRWEELDPPPALEELDHEDSEKETRILGTLQPLDHAGKFLLRKEMRSAIEQRRMMPHLGRGKDDVLDAIEMAVAVSHPPPEMTIHEWAYRRHHTPKEALSDAPRPWMIV